MEDHPAIMSDDRTDGIGLVERRRSSSSRSSSGSSSSSSSASFYDAVEYDLTSDFDGEAHGVGVVGVSPLASVGSIGSDDDGCDGPAPGHAAACGSSGADGSVELLGRPDESGDPATSPGTDDDPSESRQQQRRQQKQRQFASREEAEGAADGPGSGPLGPPERVDGADDDNDDEDVRVDIVDADAGDDADEADGSCDEDGPSSRHHHHPLQQLRPVPGLEPAGEKEEEEMDATANNCPVPSISISESSAFVRPTARAATAAAVAVIPVADAKADDAGPFSSSPAVDSGLSPSARAAAEMALRVQQRQRQRRRAMPTTLDDGHADADDIAGAGSPAGPAEYDDDIMAEPDGNLDDDEEEEAERYGFCAINPSGSYNPSLAVRSSEEATTNVEEGEGDDVHVHVLAGAPSLDNSSLGIDMGSTFSSSWGDDYVDLRGAGSGDGSPSRRGRRSPSSSGPSPRRGGSSSSPRGGSSSPRGSRGGGGSSSSRRIRRVFSKGSGLSSDHGSVKGRAGSGSAAAGGGGGVASTSPCYSSVRSLRIASTESTEVDSAELEEEGGTANADDGAGHVDAAAAFTIKDRDTGATYDIRELECGNIEIECPALALFPSRDELLGMQRAIWSSSGGGGGGKGDADATVTGAGGATTAAAVAAASAAEGLAVAGAGDGSGSSAHGGKVPTSSEKCNGSGGGDGGKSGRSSPSKKIAGLHRRMKGKGGGSSSRRKRSSPPSSSSSTLRRKASIRGKHRRRVPSPLAVLPSNAVPVRRSHKQQSDGGGSSAFDPLLLIGSKSKAHEGPIWSMSFSHDGRYLATAGEDGVVLIWEVAPARSADKVHRRTDPSPTMAATAGEEGSAGGAEREQPSPEPDQRPSSPPPSTHGGSTPALGREIQILSSEPIRRYAEHGADVVDLSWSHTNFLLSASLDKTVRLWHVSRPRCLHIFQHADLVSCVDFHPTEDAVFLSGSFDRKLRVWSIPRGMVTEWAQAPDIVTSARYVPGGEYVVAGLFRGQLIFYYADSLKYYTQIRSANRHGSKRGGKKVTGFAFLRTCAKSEKPTDEDRTAAANAGGGAAASSPDKASSQQRKKAVTKLSPKIILQQSWSPFSQGGRGDLLYKEQMLVTTNDSRLRLFGLGDFSMIRKYKGLRNNSMQISAKISESGGHIICGSDVGMVFIWDTSTKAKPLRLNVSGTQNYDKSNRFEFFQASQANPPIVTDTLFVPSRALKDAFHASGLFPTLSNMNHLPWDFGSGAILTSDYEGSVRIFLRKELFSLSLKAAGPEGHL